MWILILALAAIFVIGYAMLPKIYVLRGNIAYEKSGLKNAIKFYEKAYRTNRASASAKLNYALLILRDGRPEDSEKLFNEIILSPQTAPKHKNSAKQYRCMAYIKQGKAEEAFETASELLKVYKNSSLYAIAGYALLLSDKDASKLCEEAYEYNPDNRDIADNYATSLIISGNLSEAVSICDDVIQKNRFFPEGYYHKALALKEMGKYDDALKVLEMLDDCEFNYLTTIDDDDIEKLKSETEVAKNAGI